MPPVDSEISEKSANIIALLSYGLVLFCSGFLMFTIEPYIAKRLLPYLGGSVNVWNTCVVFFQVTLILGYLYSHLISTKLSFKNQKLVHLVILLLPIFFSNFIPPNILSIGIHPFFWILTTLVSMIGAIFFSLSTIAPLLQRWYSNSNNISSADPYFLFSLSNLGALSGLVCYPFLIENNFGLNKQASIIYGTYIFIACLIAVIALIFASAKTEVELSEVNFDEKEADLKGSTTDYWQWLIYSIVPASLVLGVTSYITSELSAIPLLWIIPLFLYLLSFVIAYARPPQIVFRICNFLCPISAVIVLAIILFQITATTEDGSGFAVTSFLSIHLVALLLISISFHGKLANARPGTNKLTQYYLVIATGGMLGSCINTFFAPLFFTSWVEYPLMLALACVLSLNYSNKLELSFKNKLPKENLFFVILITGFCLTSLKSTEFLASIQNQPNQISPLLLTISLIPVCLSVVLAKSTHQLRLGVGIAMLFIVFSIFESDSSIVYKSRNFYGCMKVTENRISNVVTFWHGMTVHGSESLDPDLRSQPEAYFHPNGPIGEVFKILNSIPSKESTKNPVAVIGLGCGTLASYGNPKQKMFFYELNPEVIEIASNPLFFTYLFDAKKRGVNLEIIQGDGRLSLKKAPYKFFNAIILDAFNSDSIPTHLITKEALELYLSKLKEDGIIAFQVTNNYFDLKPELKLLAKDASLYALYKNDYGLQRETKRFPTEWVIMSKNKELLERFQSKEWKEIDASKQVGLWTDDYSNPLPLLISPLN